MNDQLLNEMENSFKNEAQNSVSRRTFMKQSVAATAGVVASNEFLAPTFQKTVSKPPIKITDLKCAIIGNYPIVRITTDQGIEGYGQAESSKSYLKPFVLFYKDYLVGEDPTNVQRIMMKIHRMGSFKPWGAAVSAIEVALWDIAGKAAGLPVYKLLGGKVRDQVRAYNGSVRVERTGSEPKDYYDWAQKIKALPQGFTIVKTGISFTQPKYSYGNITPSKSLRGDRHLGPGAISEYGLKKNVECVAAIKEGLGEGIDLALHGGGPSVQLSDAIRIANALEPYNILWLEDMLTGDYRPYVLPDDYIELTRSTITPIHTGEQIYLRQNYRELIERHAVRIIGPDPLDIGGIAELKWVAELADLHNIMIAPHGTNDGIFGVAAQVMVGATMPENYIAFEYCQATFPWWYEITSGLPDPIVKNGLIDVWDRPGLGIEIDKKAARQYLAEEDKTFFD